jgi:mono/diheme cytochrome c family protein
MGTNSRVGWGKVSISIIFGVVMLVLGLFLYLKFGPPPVAVADSPFPFEKTIVKTALRARIARHMQDAPFSVSADVLESGARIYKDQCSGCHGTPGHDASYAKQMYPPPPQMWKRHGTHGAVGVSEFETGMTYWIVSNGIRLSGMPSFTHLLSETQMWQVSLLLKNADKEQLPTVTQILNAPTP